MRKQVSYSKFNRKEYHVLCMVDDEMGTVIYVPPPGTTGECKAKIRVDMEIDGLGIRHEELICCLWAPHPLYKHMNPRIQATIGGDRWTEDKEWSYYLEKLPTPISSFKKGSK